MWAIINGKQVVYFAPFLRNRKYYGQGRETCLLVIDPTSIQPVYKSNTIIQTLINVKTEFLHVSTLEDLSKSSVFSDFKCCQGLFSITSLFSGLWSTYILTSCIVSYEILLPSVGTLLLCSSLSLRSLPGDSPGPNPIMPPVHWPPFRQKQPYGDQIRDGWQ